MDEKIGSRSEQRSIQGVTQEEIVHHDAAGAGVTPLGAEPVSAWENRRLVPHF
jgi:hypothetical protein